MDFFLLMNTKEDILVAYISYMEVNEVQLFGKTTFFNMFETTGGCGNDDRILFFQ